MSNSSTVKYPAGPLTNVLLRSGYEISESSWGKTIRYADLPGLGAAILYAIVTKPGRLLNTELIYLRRKLDLSQAQCAQLIGVKEQTLSLWERDKYLIPIAGDALLRRICIEELGNSFPKKIQFPKTSSLVRLASSINSGVYECIFDQNSWVVRFEGAETDKSIVPIITFVNSQSLNLTPDKFELVEVRGTLSTFGQIHKAPTRAIAIPERRAGRTMLGQVSGKTYKANPITGAMYLLSSRTAATEGNIL